MPKSAIAVRHLHFEGLGTFEPELRNAGFDVRYVDIFEGGLEKIDPLAPDLLVVLGGPIGVYEEDLYPFLALENELLKRRLSQNRPTLGICLGAQLMATALGARVAPSGVKEIGFSSLTLTGHGRTGPLRHLEGAQVLHWHGDRFAIPDGAERLASTQLCDNQAFSIGNNILGLQFHPEFDAQQGIEAWLIGHSAEMSAAGIDPRALRGQAAQHGAQLGYAARAMFRDWLDGVGF